MRKFGFVLPASIEIQPMSLIFKNQSCFNVLLVIFEVKYEQRMETELAVCRNRFYFILFIFFGCLLCVCVCVLVPDVLLKRACRFVAS